MTIHYEYFFDDDDVNAFLYIVENVPRNSVILGPNYSSNHYEIYEIIYGYGYTHYVSKFSTNTSFNDFEYFINVTNIDYLLIKKQDYNQSVIISLQYSSYYSMLMENTKYQIYIVI